ncbi:MAG: succinyl-diaminopimelate desuccinylase [Gammaproteobacteria bacterium]|nr:MAG: succinyl-diaminopimelate desuccinylase [Gammaproteobacteria bacterium]
MSQTVELAKALINLQSETPNDAGCQDLISKQLESHGFIREQLDYGDTKNLWLRRGNSEPLFVFLGHTDVVPTGPVELWNSPPFEATIKDGLLYGRGSADMKSSIAAMITACQQFVEQQPDHKGSIAFLITSDEEGPATDGTVKVIEALTQRGDKVDWCLVGEPSSDQKLGDAIRVGRRGSLNGKLIVNGIQGHVAYPHKAENPIHRFAPALDQLVNETWDNGNEFFPATSFQISNIKGGAGAENIIPGNLEVDFNFRYSTELTADQIKQRVETILQKHNINYDLSWRLSGAPFLTTEKTLINATQAALFNVMGAEAEASTAGGTSDGRFIAPYGIEVVELGPINESIHKINEHVLVKDIGLLADIYRVILERLLVLK